MSVLYCKTRISASVIRARLCQMWRRLRAFTASRLNRCRAWVNFSGFRLLMMIKSKQKQFSVFAGFGRFHLGRRWFWLHLCEHGLECQSRQHAWESATTAREHLRQASLSCAVEVRVVDEPKRFTVERENLTLAAATGPARPQEVAGIRDARRFIEHVRDCLPWRTSGCYARLLRSRLKLGESEGGWIR